MNCLSKSHRRQTVVTVAVTALLGICVNFFGTLAVAAPFAAVDQAKKEVADIVLRYDAATGLGYDWAAPR